VAKVNGVEGAAKNTDHAIIRQQGEPEL
jgi:hypothetical protein